MFDDIGPIETYGQVVEQRQLVQFFFGVTVLSAIGVFLLAGVFIFVLGIDPGVSVYFVAIPSAFLIGAVSTVLAVRLESSAVFVPYFRVSPTDDCQVYRSTERLDAETFEYQIIVGESTDAVVVRYRGRGESREHISVTAVEKTTMAQIDHDATHLTVVSRPVNIASFRFS
jgi:hypothetical protein